MHENKTLRQREGQRWARRKANFSHILLDLTEKGVNERVYKVPPAGMCAVRGPINQMTLSLQDKGAHPLFKRKKETPQS